MTHYIVWPVDKTDELREIYVILTGEEIQETPVKNTAGDKYMVSSDRVNDTALGVLNALSYVEITESYPVF